MVNDISFIFKMKCKISEDCRIRPIYEVDWPSIKAATRNCLNKLFLYIYEKVIAFLMIANKYKILLRAFRLWIHYINFFALIGIC